ncbi:MAG TPA: MauE/DoxX family redox-associated membrane protein [Gaiellaceae bacterium]|nr:MauE/DoxX family redox-associated membrane protein [Gaiellaceae bacterium]
MHVIAQASSVAVATYLLVPGFLKFGRFSALAETVQALGVVGAAKLVAASLIATEVCAGFLELLRPGSIYTAAGVAAVFAVFGAAGAMALARGSRVDCSCFGPVMRRRKLGWFQLVQLPAIAALVFVAYRGAQGASEEMAMAISFLYAVGAGSLIVFVGRRPFLKVRRQRLSINPLYAKPKRYGLT